MSAPLPRTVRGKRPDIHADPASDRLIAMVLALASEMSVLKDRLASMQALAERHGWLAAGAVDGYVPDLEERGAREREREAFLDRIFHVLKEELSDLEQGETRESYWRAVEGIERGEL